MDGCVTHCACMPVNATQCMNEMNETGRHAGARSQRSHPQHPPEAVAPGASAARKHRVLGEGARHVHVDLAQDARVQALSRACRLGVRAPARTAGGHVQPLQPKMRPHRRLDAVLVHERRTLRGGGPRDVPVARAERVPVRARHARAERKLAALPHRHGSLEPKRIACQRRRRRCRRAWRRRLHWPTLRPPALECAEHRGATTTTQQTVQSIT